MCRRLLLLSGWLVPLAHGASAQSFCTSLLSNCLAPAFSSGAETDLETDLKCLQNIKMDANLKSLCLRTSAQGTCPSSCRQILTRVGKDRLSSQPKPIHALVCVLCTTLGRRRWWAALPLALGSQRARAASSLPDCIAASVVSVKSLFWVAGGCRCLSFVECRSNAISFMVANCERRFSVPSNLRCVHGV